MVDHRRSELGPARSRQAGGEASRTGERGAAAPAAFAIFAVVLVVAIVAWRFWPRDQRDLVIVGDSVTFLSIGAIEDEIDGWDLDIRAYPGQASTELVLVLLQELAERDQVGEGLEAVALLVGYNDVLRYRGQPDEVQQLVDLAAGARCAVVLTVPAPPEWSDQQDLDEVRDAFDSYDERLLAAAAEHDNVHVVTAWQEQVESSGPGELVDTDGVHPVEAGQRTLAEVYALAVAEHC